MLIDLQHMINRIKRWWFNSFITSRFRFLFWLTLVFSILIVWVRSANDGDDRSLTEEEIIHAGTYYSQSDPDYGIELTMEGTLVHLQNNRKSTAFGNKKWKI